MKSLRMNNLHFNKTADKESKMLCWKCKQVDSDQNSSLISVFRHGMAWKHAYIIFNPLNPTFISKTGVYRSIHYFSYFYSKT